MISSWRMITRWHTGTVFVQEMFARAGFLIYRGVRLDAVTDKPVLFVAHVQSMNGDALLSRGMQISRLPLLTLARNDRKIRRSWQRRYRALASSSGSFRAQREQWAKSIEPTANFILDITDEENRDRQLAQLSELVGVQLDPNGWVPVNTTEGYINENRL